VTGRAVGDLLPLEKRVWDRINQVAVGGVVPVSALLFPDPGAAWRWDKALRVEVVAEARRLGLSQRRFSPPVVTALTTGAFAAATVVFGVILYASRAYLRPPSWTAGGCLGAFAALAVTGV